DGRTGPVIALKPNGSGDGWIKVGSARIPFKAGEAEVVDKNALPPIGKPLNTRIDQIKQAVADGTPVKIFTARAADPEVPRWLKENGLGDLPVTNVKGHDFGGLIDNVVNVPTNSDTPFEMPVIP